MNDYYHCSFIVLSYYPEGQLTKDNPVEWIQFRIKTLELPTKQLILEKAKEHLTEERMEFIKQDIMFMKIGLGVKRLTCDHIGHIAILKMEN